MEFQEEVPTTENHVRVIAKRFSCKAFFIPPYSINTEKLKMEWRLIQSGKLDARDNMAIDEALFRSYRPGTGILRLYGWKGPSLSLGYHQKIKGPEREGFFKKGIQVVRRPTGGGAVYHQEDLSYAVVVRPSASEGFRFWCRRLNEAVISGLRQLGIEARLRDEKESPQDDFLCFVNKSKYDIVRCGQKLAGSAQRVRQGVILQQGSILSGDDPRQPPGTTSLSKILGRDAGFDEVSGCLIRGFEGSLKIRLIPTELREVLRDEKTGGCA